MFCNFTNPYFFWRLLNGFAAKSRISGRPRLIKQTEQSKRKELLGCNLIQLQFKTAIKILICRRGGYIWISQERRALPVLMLCRVIEFIVGLSSETRPGSKHQSLGCNVKPCSIQCRDTECSREGVYRQHYCWHSEYDVRLLYDYRNYCLYVLTWFNCEQLHFVTVSIQTCLMCWFLLQNLLWYV